MCGISGFISPKPVKNSTLEVDLTCLKHRGGDHRGIAYVKGGAIEIHHDMSKVNSVGYNAVLVHDRFTIQGLSSGRQPLVSTGFIMLFNGEIFNTQDLATKHNISSDLWSIGMSDSELLVLLWEKLGVLMFNELKGFWAITIYDKNTGEVIMSRDRYGQKPLYYKTNDEVLYFSSELKSFNRKRVNDNAVLDYLMFDRRNMRFDSVYDITQVSASSYMIFTFSESKNVWEVSTEKYYQINSLQSFQGEYRDAVKLFRDVFINSVERRLLSDVPVALSLSGGLDSSAIAYAIAELGRADEVKAFNFRYDSSEYGDESMKARSIAKHFGIEFDVLDIPLRNSFDKNLDSLIKMQEEPVHSYAALAQTVSLNAIRKNGFKVVLNGSASDELLYGYPYYQQMRALFSLRKGVLPKQIQNRYWFYYKNLARIMKWALNGNIAHPVNLLRYKNVQAEYLSNQGRKWIINYDFLRELDINSCKELSQLDFEKLRIPYWNMQMDKSSMSTPVELRIPFLDSDLVDLVFSFPEEYLYRGEKSKGILRDLVKGNMPESVIKEKDKIGFQSPDLNLGSHLPHTSYNSYFSQKAKENWLNLDKNLRWRIYNLSRWESLEI